ANAAWKLDEDLGAVVKGAQRPPSGGVAFDRIPEIEPGEVEPDVDRGGGFGDRIVPAQGDQLVLRVLPGDRGHVGLLGGAQLKVIGTAVGVDDQIGEKIRASWLDLDVDAFRRPGPAFGVAN